MNLLFSLSELTLYRTTTVICNGHNMVKVRMYMHESPKRTGKTKEAEKGLAIQVF